VINRESQTASLLPVIRQLLAIFQNSFTCIVSNKFLTNWSLKMPQHLKLIIILPRETHSGQKLIYLL